MHGCKTIVSPPTLSGLPQLEVLTVNMKECEALTAPPLVDGGMPEQLQTVKVELQKCKAVHSALCGDFKTRADYIAKLKEAGIAIQARGTGKREAKEQTQSPKSGKASK